MSQPPMTATAFVFPLMRQRPLVLCPLMMATCQRRSASGPAWCSGIRGGAAARAGPPSRRRGRPGSWPRGPARPARRTRRASTGPRRRARAAPSPSGRDRRRPHARSARRRPPLAGGRWSSGTGRSAMGTSLPGPAGPGQDLTTRQIPRRAAVRLVRRARHPECGGLRALPAARPGGHRGLHGERRRQGDPRRGVARRGHDHARGRGRPARPALRARTRARLPVVRHLPARLPGQDERHRGLGGPPPPRRRRRLRLRRGAALGHRLPAAPRSGAAGPPSSWRPTCATGCRRAGTSPRAATPVRPCSSATAPGSWPSWWRPPRPPTSSPTAGARRATASRSCGRSASARTATSPWARSALGRALEAAGLEAGDIGRLVVTGMHGRAVSGLTKKLGLAEGVAVDDLTVERGPERHGAPAARPGLRPRIDGRPTAPRPARPWWCSTWPTAPTRWCCGPPTP